MKAAEAQEILKKDVFRDVDFAKYGVKNYEYNFIKKFKNGWSMLRVHFYFLEEGTFFTRMYDDDLLYLGESKEILVHLKEEKEKLESKVPRDIEKIKMLDEIMEPYRLMFLLI